MNLVVPYKAPLGAGTGDMLKANNLGDVVSVASARANLDVMSWGQSAGRAVEAAGGLVFDGKTNPHQVLGSLSGQNIGTDDFSLWLRLKVPEAAASGTATLVVLSDDGTGSRPRALAVYFDTGNHLYVRLYGTTTADYRTLQLTSFRSTRQGQAADLVLVRNASGLTPYVNGTQWTATSEATAGTPPAWTDTVTNAYWRLGDAVTTAISWAAYRAALFNCALGAAEIEELLNVGLARRFKWGSQGEMITSQENRDFNGGTTGNWLVNGGSALSNPDTKLQVTLAGSGTSGAGLYSNYISSYGAVRRLRIAADVWRGTTAATAFTVMAGSTSQNITISATQTTFTVDVTTGANAGLYIRTAASDGGTFFIDNVSVKALGAVADLDLGVGKGEYIPDRSSNRLWAEKTPSSVTHKLERQSGEFVVGKTLAHSDISATGETTALFTLPANCGILDVECDRETAFDSGTTLDIGITGSNGKYVSGANVAATGKLLADSGSKASESASAATTVYVKKNQATTQGQTTVRVRCGIRG